MPRTKLTSLTVERLLKNLPKTGQVFHWDAALPGFALRLGKTGGSWVCAYRIMGGSAKIFDTIGAASQYTLAEARELAREKLRLKDKGLDPRLEQARQVRIAAKHRRETVGGAALEYKADHL